MIPTLADLLADLGGISPARVIAQPAPGLGTENDLLRLDAREDRLCELIHGVIVEKASSVWSGLLSMALGSELLKFVHARNLGLVTAASAPFRLVPGLVRLPDVAFASWDRLPGRRVPRESIPSLAPDLAVEFLCDGKTPGELTRKRREYFEAGVRLVWMIDPRARTTRVFEPDRPSIALDISGVLDGGDVLPGFRLPLTGLFAEFDRHG